jgi:hypothetical protein
MTLARQSLTERPGNARSQFRLRRRLKTREILVAGSAASELGYAELLRSEA